MGPLAISLIAAVSAHASRPAPAALPKRILVCLKRASPGFSPWSRADFFGLAIEGYPHAPKQSPSAVIGDFDGDGATDAALYGRRKDKTEILVVFSSGERCETKTLLSTTYENPAKIRVHFGDKSGYGLTTTLERAAPKIYASPHEKSPLALKHDAVIVRDFGKAATLYHYANGGFSSYALAD